MKRSAGREESPDPDEDGIQPDRLRWIKSIVVAERHGSVSWHQETAAIGSGGQRNTSVISISPRALNADAMPTTNGVVAAFKEANRQTR